MEAWDLVAEELRFRGCLFIIGLNFDYSPCNFMKNSSSSLISQ
jgi:hypothetical protein